MPSALYPSLRSPPRPRLAAPVHHADSGVHDCVNDAGGRSFFVRSLNCAESGVLAFGGDSAIELFSAAGNAWAFLSMLITAIWRSVEAWVEKIRLFSWTPDGLETSRERLALMLSAPRSRCCSRHLVVATRLDGAMPELDSCRSS